MDFLKLDDDVAVLYKRDISPASLGQYNYGCVTVTPKFDFGYH
jgi:hypothetical protein